MKAAIALGMTFLMACASAPSASVPPASGSQEIADDALKVLSIHGIEQQVVTCRDRNPMPLFYWQDAELVDPSGNIWRTGPDIVQMHVDLWKTAFKGSTVTGVVRRTRQLSPTLMIVDLDLDLKVVGPLPPSIPN